MFCYDRLDLLFKETGKKKSHILNAIGRPAYYFKDCQKINKDLSDAEVKVIAAELGTTPAYLRGETDEKNIPNEVEELSAIKDRIDKMSLAELMDLGEFIAKLAREKMEK